MQKHDRYGRSVRPTKKYSSTVLIDKELISRRALKICRAVAPYDMSRRL